MIVRFSTAIGLNYLDMYTRGYSIPLAAKYKSPMSFSSTCASVRESISDVRGGGCLWEGLRERGREREEEADTQRQQVCESSSQRRRRKKKEEESEREKQCGCSQEGHKH